MIVILVWIMNFERKKKSIFIPFYFIFSGEIIAPRVSLVFIIWDVMCLSSKVRFIDEYFIVILE